MISANIIMDRGDEYTLDGEYYLDMELTSWELLGTRGLSIRPLHAEKLRAAVISDIYVS